MPRQNRVTPFGGLISTSARGTLMGNRGCLHDNHGAIRRSYQGTRWILCLLDFKNRRRSIMTPGQYTELFFLDEATGLAAGHRPCAECQRERFNLFREAWARANPALADTLQPAAPAIDAVLHQERVTTAGQKRAYLARLDDLPDHVFVAVDGDPSAYLVLKDRLLRWSPFGYEESIRRLTAAPVRALTPPSVVRALAAGYTPGLHSSAYRALARREK